jgi:aspartate-semialdehyde dehydrogenase
VSSARALRIAVVGAATLIGEAVIEELRARRVPYAELHALDEAHALGRGRAGTSMEEDEPRLALDDVARFDFERVDLALFCGRGSLSERYAESVARAAWVIDGSDRFSNREDVPLVAADVNPQVLEALSAPRLIALAGSASVALATALAPLDAWAGAERVDVVSLHAVSGSGRGAVDELAAETVSLLSGRPARGRAYGTQIAFNVIPQVGRLQEEGGSSEERRVARETCRLLGSPALSINSTAVRVPVFFGHSLAVHAQFARAVSVAGALEFLQRGTGLEVIDTDSDAEFPTPATFATAPHKVYLGRLRMDGTRDRALNFWVVADNVRKCAAHNAVSVAQILVNHYL